MQSHTLALNLMISERADQRKKFAEMIREEVDSEQNISSVAEIFKAKLFLHVDRCVENPNCSSRTVLFGLAEFWNTFFKTRTERPLLAA
ncbi:MAG: hypothetical protein EOO50_08585 [Flavobacterium sp.]|uniref:hypothetical protein n=1 Tax=Flavobacterium sp. TaxID=239 RepID=UPI0011F5AAED|nr:hypothetical protein [Flavobacterium sp.]RZJ66739.1 MAG: hypothetical protein EOO50_08585 [Flavobacterium sp.]